LAHLYDPESRREKIDRAKAHLSRIPELSLRGGHVMLTEVCETLEVDQNVLHQATAELIKTDTELSLQDVAGVTILKRRRI
jgi:hypothetical protein